jgi:hypothetical protein
MNRPIVISLMLACTLAPSMATAQSSISQAMPAATSAKMSPLPTAAEAPFIAKIQSDIPARYPTTAAARKAGYFQYTGEDKTGAISYVDLNVWNAADRSRLHRSRIAIARAAGHALRVRDRPVALDASWTSHPFRIHAPRRHVEIRRDASCKIH